MHSQPRFTSLFFYGLAWGFVPLVILTGTPWIFLIPGIFIQVINTFSVAQMPVRVSIQEGEIQCHFPLTGKTRTLNLAPTERYIQRNPIGIFRFSDFVVLRSPTANVKIWRLGTKDFEQVCDSL